MAFSFLVITISIPNDLSDNTYFGRAYTGVENQYMPLPHIIINIQYPMEVNTQRSVLLNQKLLLKNNEHIKLTGKKSLDILLGVGNLNE